MSSKASTSVWQMFALVMMAALAGTLLLAAGALLLSGSAHAQAQPTLSFQKGLLQGEISARPTSLQFGPDGRLYVGQQNGLINVYTITRNGPADYAVTATETIDLIKKIPNRNDDGTLNTSETNRQVTGILVTGTATNPVIYASSSDPRIGAGSSGTDANLDTNSGVVSRLTWNGTSWNKVDLVRGLPRSEENHSVNGMQLDKATNTLYLAVGGNTNKGAPSNNFALLPEYALAAAILKIDLNAIGNTTYDLPTLDDENRAGSPDANDPFGGNDGKNQAKIVPGGPVQVYAPGFRNAYDLVIASSGKMYTIDNGGNAGWGDIPVNEGPGGACTNGVNEPGTTTTDSLHYVSGAGYYGGHPNPTRGNMANTFNTSNPQSPVSTANAVECDFRANGAEKGNLTTFPASTNGLTEYTASHFSGAMKGDLLAASFDNNIYRMKLNSVGDAVVTKEVLFSTVGQHPLDVTAQGDAGPFAGTIWVADHSFNTGSIVAFEPLIDETCNATYDPNLDSDGDGYSNADEIDNGTDPCSPADTPPDNDGDKVSDLKDPDDDNDTLPDTSDPFAVDKDNGKTTNLPVTYTWDNDAPQASGLLNLGFTGLMTNKTANYSSLYNPNNMTAGGAAGAVTVDKVPPGDAHKTLNTQQYGFQFGVNATATTGKFTAHTQILAPFAGITPQDYQSMGLFVGNGDQDNYIKLVTTANNGAGGIEFAKEVSGAFGKKPLAAVSMPGPDYVDLYLTVDPAAKTVRGSYAVTTNGVTGTRKDMGTFTSIPADWFGGTTGFAVGIISTSKGPGPEFPATWGSIEVIPGEGLPAEGLPGQWQTLAPSSTNRQEVAYVQSEGKFYLAGGSTLHERYDPKTNSWSQVKSLPESLDHIQGVELGGKIYYIGGLSGWPGPQSDNVYIYDPKTDTISQGAPMPADRARGAGGVAAYNGKIYVAGGLHNGAAVPWFDVYDPVANTWAQLPNMPRAKDHFHAAVVDGKFYAIGGRDTAINATIDKVDVYDLASGAAGTWQTPNTALPTPRGGFAAAVLGKEILIIGGEGGGTTYNAVEAYNTTTNSWRQLKPMPTARHGTQAAVCNGGVYIAAGGKAQGGGSPTNVHEAFFLNGPTSCDAPTGDTTAPMVASTAPQDGAAGVAIGANAEATFSEAMDASTINDAEGDGNFTLKNGTQTVAANVSYDATAKKATLDPNAPLAANTTYTAIIKGGANGVKDLAGNPLAADKSWSFTTASAADTTPPETTIDLGPSGTVSSASATFSFSSSETGSTFECSLDGAAFSSCTSPKGYTNVSDGQHTFEVKATDAAGNTDATPAKQTWTIDTSAPTVADVAPAQGATGVSVSSNVVATFTEDMRQATIDTATFELVKQGSTTPVGATVAYDATAKKATLDPNAPLAANTTYTAIIKGGANGVKDLAGNPLAADKSWSFTTAASVVANGLKGEYYDNKDLTNLKLTRTDAIVNFGWGSGSPDPSIAPDTFSVRWSGQVKADHTETYTFYTTANDGVRLWVNGQQIVNRWSDGAKTNTGTVSLQAGQWYDITMEYYEGINTASVMLEYSSPSTPRQVVPTDHLRPDAASS